MMIYYMIKFLLYKLGENDAAVAEFYLPHGDAMRGCRADQQL
jgi:hypothetical protein